MYVHAVYTVHTVYYVCSCKLTYCIFAPLTFITEFFLSLNDDKMFSKRRVINLVSLFFFLLNSTSKTIFQMKIFIRTSPLLGQKKKKISKMVN